MKKDLIQKTKTGKIYNISFKMDDQTRAREYGESYSGNIKLEHWIYRQESGLCDKTGYFCHRRQV